VVTDWSCGEACPLDTGGSTGDGDGGGGGDSVHDCGRIGAGGIGTLPAHGESSLPTNPSAGRGSTGSPSTSEVEHNRRVMSRADPPTRTATFAAMSSPRDIVTGYLDALGTDDPDRIASFVSPGFHNDHFSELGASCEGRDEYRRRLPNFLATFTDRSYEIDDLVAETRGPVTDVVARYRFRAKFTDDGGITSTFTVPGVMWFVVEGSQITRRIDVWDSQTFVKQTSPVADG
jgi:hypothetical protein